jgi:outer membrane protein assembly factor BamB
MAAACKFMCMGFLLGVLQIVAFAADPKPLIVVVMDPLAAPLSCPCVKGYAQRDYTKLGEFLEEQVAQPVVVKFGESLSIALKDIPDQHAHVVIGKHSVVLADGKRLARTLRPVAALSGKDGYTMQRGLIVVRANDSAQKLSDLADYRIILGPADCDEKHAAARKLLSEHGVEVAQNCPISEACSNGAAEVVEAGEKGRVVTVISSYAQPLLEGCGTIKKGDLRVIGETHEVPFVTAFVDAEVAPALQEKIIVSLLAVKKQPLLRLALETKHGFETFTTDEKQGEKTSSTQPSNDWPGWRGANRSAVVTHLPEQLPSAATVVWKKTLLNEGLGGPAVANGLLVVGDRDIADTSDIFHAVNAATGERRWSLRYAAEGRLDYGNSPRATPLIHGEFVYTLGAFGHLHCLRATDGKVIWKKHIRDDFQVREPLVWGVCSSPLIVDDKLIINPGAPQASLIALAPATGELLWQTPGAPAAFASFIVGNWGNRLQIIGFDKTTCGGWDPTTGRRLWSLAAKNPGDFNVPTPVTVGEKVLLTTENNGTRLLEFASDQEPRVVATYDKLAPDMHTAVVSGNRIFAVNKNKVFCFDSETLALQWSDTDRSLSGHVSLIASSERVLLLTQKGELVLMNALADKLQILSRLSLFEDEVSLYAHPALAREHIYIRGPGKLICLALKAV